MQLAGLLPMIQLLQKIWKSYTNSGPDMKFSNGGESN